MTFPALDRILAATTVQLDAFALCEVSPDAQIMIPPLTSVEIHYVLRGTLHLEVDGSDPLTLGAASVVVVPPGRGQLLAASATPSKVFESRAICSTRSDGLRYYDAGQRSADALRVMCAQVRAEVAGGLGLFDGLTRPIMATLERSSIMTASVDAMLAEADAPGPFSRSLTGALMKACLILALRDHLERKGTVGLPGLFTSTWLGRAVGAIMERPEAPHTVVTLADVAGRSRSTFAKVFSEQLGVPPMEFVTQARLARAHTLLMRSDAPINAVASQAGFASRSHFSRIFRDTYGTDPRTYRRTQRTPESVNV